jgi:hypothetical protein
MARPTRGWWRRDSDTRLARITHVSRRMCACVCIRVSQPDSQCDRLYARSPSFPPPCRVPLVSLVLRPSSIPSRLAVCTCAPRPLPICSACRQDHDEYLGDCDNWYDDEPYRAGNCVGRKGLAALAQAQQHLPLLQTLDLSYARVRLRAAPWGRRLSPHSRFCTLLESEPALRSRSVNESLLKTDVAPPSARPLPFLVVLRAPPSAPRPLLRVYGLRGRMLIAGTFIRTGGSRQGRRWPRCDCVLTATSPRGTQSYWPPRHASRACGRRRRSASGRSRARARSGSPTSALSSGSAACCAM